MKELNTFQKLRKELYEAELGNLVKAELAFNFIIYGTYKGNKEVDYDIDKSIKFD